MINEKWSYEFEKGKGEGNRRMQSKERDGGNDYNYIIISKQK